MARPCNYCAFHCGCVAPNSYCGACQDNVRAEAGGATPFAGELFAALNELVYLKEFKPADYEQRKPVAWQKAREVLDRVRESKGETTP